MRLLYFFMPILFLFIHWQAGELKEKPGHQLNGRVNSDKDFFENQERPNIVFFLSDDHTVYDYGCYGNSKVHTPAIDRLSKEGLLFRQAFTGQAICAPSRSMLFTGKYPIKNGCCMNHIPTKPSIRSITHYLQQLGYEVVLSGKSHVSGTGVFNWDKHIDVLADSLHIYGLLDIPKTIEYIRSAKKPFCLFITSTLPHVPFPNVTAKSVSDFQFLPFDPKPDARILANKAGYYENIRQENDEFDTILLAIDKYLAKNTVTIYASDHGNTGKYTVYDRGLNVPLIIRYPGVTKAGSVTNQLVSFVDILPTLNELAGGKDIDDIDGKSLLPVLKENKKEIHEYVYGVSENQNTLIPSVFPSRMIRDKRYKYICNFNSIEVVKQNLTNKLAVDHFILKGAEKFRQLPYEELFDISTDPYELNNLAKDSKFQHIRVKMRSELLSWMTSQSDYLITNKPMPLLYPFSNSLDKHTQLNPVDEQFRNSLKDEDYIFLHLGNYIHK